MFTGSSVNYVYSSFTAGTNTILTVDVGTNVTSTVAASFSGTSVIKGNFIASGMANGFTQAGGVLKGVGYIFANVSISANANLSAGLSPGTIFVNGDLTLASTSTTEIEADSSTNYDTIVVSGTANLNGFCWLKLVGYQPSSAQTFLGIVKYRSYSGSFAGVNAEGFTNFFESKTTAKYNTFTTDLTFTPNSGSVFSVLMILSVVLVFM